MQQEASRRCHSRGGIGPPQVCTWPSPSALPSQPPPRKELFAVCGASVVWGAQACVSGTGIQASSSSRPKGPPGLRGPWKGASHTKPLPLMALATKDGHSLKAQD